MERRLGGDVRESQDQGVAGRRQFALPDLRGTAATKFYVAGLSERVIAEVMGWEEASVRKIIRRYMSGKPPCRTASGSWTRPEREHSL